MICGNCLHFLACVSEAAQNGRCFDSNYLTIYGCKLDDFVFNPQEAHVKCCLCGVDMTPIEMSPKETGVDWVKCPMCKSVAKVYSYENTNVTHRVSWINRV